MGYSTFIKRWCRYFFLLCMVATAVPILQPYSSCLMGFEVQLPPKITLKIDSEVLVVDQPIPVIVSVIHSYDQHITVENISFDEQIVSIRKIGEEVLNPSNIYSSDIAQAPVITRFQVILPGKKSGIHTIGPIHLQLGKFSFDSAQMTINVQSPEISSDFQLFASVLHQEKVLYPGQGCIVEYRLLYKDPLKILKQDLPLLKMGGFVTDGSPTITTFQDGDYFIQRIQQRLKAVSTGSFESGISVMEAMRVVDRGYGKELIPPLMRAQAPSVSIKVDDFPQSGRPSTFFGAIGSYAWRARLLTPSIIQTADPVEIEYRISGRGDLSTVEFPPKEAFYTVEENFIIVDWPDIGKEEENTKTFILKLRSRRPGSFLIPGITVSSFDPTSGKYLTTSTLPVQLEVKGKEGENFSLQPSQIPLIGVTYPIIPVEIVPSIFSKIYWRFSHLAYCFLSAVFLIAFQVGLKRYFSTVGLESAEKKHERAQVMFEQAFLKKNRLRESCVILKRAMYQRLFEVGLTRAVYHDPSELDSSVPLLKEAIDFLKRIDQYLYDTGSLPGHEERQEFFESAAFLYYKLKSLPDMKKETDASNEDQARRDKKGE